MSTDFPMTIKAARAAIEAILAAIPDDELPEFDKVEIGTDGKVTAWRGGSGKHLGSAMRDGVREPLIYRSHAAWEAIQSEMTYRADRRLLDNGDNPEGVRLARRRVAR